MADEETLRDYLKWATANLHDARQRLREMEDREHEPIAIIGMGCRFPGGVNSPEELWELVAAGTDAVGPFPGDRGWDAAALHAADFTHSGGEYARLGGFLPGAAEFDSGFFGISPREAVAMDPQQRLLLEVSWEALERAAIPPESLRGSRTGVFTGASSSGYDIGLLMTMHGTGGLEGHLLTGNMTSVLSGRVSYFLGLEGPSVTVDTACSSSLVSLHLACQALRAGECELALTGGVAVMATPGNFIEFSSQGGLASDGRCKAFGAAADGTGWSEGIGVLVVERLSDAVRNGHRVLAVVAGSAVNQDGASNGLTAPSGPSQQRVIRAALASARLSPADVDVVEGHGTGTALGDPIEAQALIAAYGRGRGDGQPLWLGSVKSNIGHTQAAAGVAGVIKMVLALRNEELPRTLHADEPSPHVDWTAGDVRLLTAPVPWPAADDVNARQRRAAISSFGVSGTNAHVVLAEAPAASDPGDGDLAGNPAGDAVGTASTGPVLSGGPVAWLVSGRSAAGLRGQAECLAEWLRARPALLAGDVAWSLAAARSNLEHRAVVTGADRAELLAGLSALASDERTVPVNPGPVRTETVLTGPVLTGIVPGGASGRVGLLFSGQGSQRAGMAAGLHAASPVFAAAFDQACGILERLLGVPVAEVALGRGPDGASDARADQTLYAQPALFAVQAGLTAMLAASGITPSAVAGHSVGEVAAALAAGVLSLEDACALVAARARLMQRLPGGGAMCAVEVPEAAAAAAAERVTGVSVAAVNGPAATVVSGESAAVEAVRTALAATGARTRMLRVSHAFHSALMDPVLGELDEVASGLAHAAPRIAWAGALDGELVTRPEPGYWAAAARRPVRFADALRTLAERGIEVFIEVGPDGTLTALGPAAVEGAAAEGRGGQGGTGDAGPVFIPLLRPGIPAVAAVTGALSRAHVTGARVDWTAVLPAGHRADLPTYAFQRQRYWPAPAAGPAPAGAGPAAEDRFWAAVTDERSAELADTLGIDAGQPFDQVLPALATWRRRQHEQSALDSWRYRVTWVPVADPAPAPLRGTWLLVVPDGQATGGQTGIDRADSSTEVSDSSTEVSDLAAACAAAITAHGAQVTVAAASAVADTCRAIEVTGGVVSLLALDEAPLPGFPVVPAGLAATVELIRVLGDAGVTARLWALTQGAVGAVAGQPPGRPVQAQTWGLGRVAALEYPERWGGLVDLPARRGQGAALDERAGARLCALLAGSPGARSGGQRAGEDQIAIRPSGILGRRLTRALPSRTSRPAGARGWAPRGTVLVTGGTGAIGGHLARWLAARAAPRVLLTSRSGPAAADIARLAAEVAHAGTDVQVTACDAAAREHLAAVLGASVPPVTAVFHTAGVSQSVPLGDTTPDILAAALGAKAAGAAHLDELTAAIELDAFVLFSSGSASWGSGLHGGYAAANAYLDALADSRHGRGLAATSVAWGMWGGGGMSEGQAAVEMKRRGLAEMDPRRAVAVLAQVLDEGEASLTVADIDWARFAPAFTVRRPSQLITSVPEAVKAIDGAPGALDAGGSGARADGELARRLAGLPRADAGRLLADLVRAEAAAVLGHTSPDAVEPGRAFKDLGFDSLTAVELRNRLGAVTGLKLPSTLVYDNPSTAALAEFLLDELAGEAGPAAGTPGLPAPAVTAEAGEPIVIVGMSCRFPGGASSPEKLWELLAGGVDAVTGFPQDRGWDNEKIYAEDPDQAGTTYVRQGAFLHDAAEFDPGFFGISPREALGMDPQQRLLLEVSWEALERAGIDPRSLHGTATGVFAGAYASGYGLDLHISGTGTSEQEASLTTGAATAVISGRVSYTLGLEGPAVTVDTACSSSLVALHLASQALRSGECTLALAGGVTVMAVPWELMAMGKTKVLAADGRCKAFGESADGMGLAEGAGMLVVERLSDARRNGHPVLAVVRASAVNQDGASNGLAAPNGRSQQRVIKTALAGAGLSPSDVDAVEAHGTGTRLGDPIEAHAVLAVYGKDRPESRPLWLGSVKSNIGHTQAAAGVAGIIKMVLALQHQELPRTLHAGQPSSQIDWSAGDVRLLTEPVPWPSNGRPRRAGVSSFGVSGTNAHLILEEPAAPSAEPAPPAGPAEEAAPDSGTGAAATLAVLAPEACANAWLVSGRSIAGLRAQAARLAEWAASRPDAGPADIAWSLATRRSTFEHRAVVLGPVTSGQPVPPDQSVPSGQSVPPGRFGAPDLMAGLSALAAGQAARSVVTGTATATGAGKVAFVFPGQGAQWTGMGTELARSSPVFAARLAECAAALAPHVDWSLEDVLAGAPGAPSLERADVAQPALWAVMVSLAEVWRAAGVTPQAVTGHSQGEIAAATVAGMLSLDDAARVVAVRSRALSGLRAPGGLLSVMMPAEAVRPLLVRWGGRLGVAAVNSPAATVVSGEPDALAELEAVLAARHIMRWPVPRSDFVAHSAAVDTLAPVLAAELALISPMAGQLPLYSTVTCQWAEGAGLDAGYWFANVRREVRFAEVIARLAADGYRTFIEVSPHAVLTGAIDEVLQAEGTAGVVTGTLDRDDSGAGRLLAALAAVHVRGQRVDWAAVLPAGRPLDLPTYAFQHEHYWLHAPQAAGPEVTRPAGGQAASPAERQFWTAVESGDLPGLAAALAIEDAGPIADLIPVLAAWRRRERRDLSADSRLYRIGWVPVADPAPAVLSGTWLLVSGSGQPDREFAARCARALVAGGARPVAVLADPPDSVRGTRDAIAARIEQALRAAAEERPVSGDDLAAAAGQAAVAQLPPVAGVLSLLALDETPVPGNAAVPSGLADTLILAQALGDAGIEAPLWTATRGAVAAGGGEAPAHPVQAHVWGLARVIEHEHPARWGGLVDLPELFDDRAAARLCAVLAGCGEDQVAVRPGGLLARRLTRAPQPDPIGPATSQPAASSPTTGRTATGMPWMPSGTVLVTGGTGAIGGHVSRWLAGLGAPRVILTSRSGPHAPAVPALAAQLAQAGTAVQITACDASARGELAALIGRIATDGEPLTAVFHAALALDDGVIDQLDTARVATVLASKALAAVYLDELTAGLDLDAFVLFSSISGTFGAGGQAGYAAANAFLDALAGSRRSRGLPALSVVWGPWAGEGTGQVSAVRRGLARNNWIKQMDPEVGLLALGRALARADSVLAVMEVDWDELAQTPDMARVRQAPLLRDLPEAHRRPAAGGTEPAGNTEQDTLAGQLAGLSRAERLRLLTHLIRAKAALVLGHAAPEAVELGRAFSDLGFDSLTAVELRNQLSAATGLPLPATVLYDYPTPAALAEQLRDRLTGDAGTERPTVSSPARTITDEPVAILAMSCRLPGGVRSPDELWDLLAAGGDGVGPLPEDRGWDLAGLYDPDPGRAGTSYVREGGFVHQAGDFDPGFFGISPREAMAMDPQQRLLLEVAWEALERAGIVPGELRGTQTGVFVGGYGSGYAIGLHLAPQSRGEFEGHLLTGNAGSVLSGRLSYVLGLEGPAVSVDTACSSSMVALHMACQALRAGECTLALVGGATIMATPFELMDMSRQEGAAMDGRCKAFGAGADGMGMAEGAAILVVERLSDARRLGHPVLAVIAGSAVNQDGASNGLTAPNGPSQQRVIRAALASAGLSPADVDAVEAHGTGTKLGDPIEAQAIMATYGQDRPDGRPLWLGSVKSNIGHAQSAAGVTGVMKVVLALQHRELPRTLHADEPSPHVDWAAGDVRLLTGPRPWPPEEGRLRRAGVSSFGISGTNAHVIVQDAAWPEADPADGGDGRPARGAQDRDGSGPAVLTGGALAWLVSARTAGGLAAQAARLADFAATRPGLDPADVAWSLATTRTAFEYRAVVTGAGREDLAAGLAGLAAGQPAPGVVTGPPVPGRVGFVFAGQGAQRAGMAAGLHAASPLFAATFDRACSLLEARLGIPVADVALGRVTADGGAGQADQTVFAQAGLFALEAGLVALLAGCGVVPDAVAGHSVGEIGAAYAAGVLTLEDACTLVAARARLMQELPPGGAMCAIAGTEAEVTASLAGVPGISVAAVNGPAAVVISGDAAAVRDIAGQWQARGRRVRPLRVSHAFHSPQMDPVLDGLARAAAGLVHAAPRVPWAGALDGTVITDPDPGYWAAQARRPVRFADALATLTAQGVTVFIEIGPDTTLSALGQAALADEAARAFIPLLRPGTPAPQTVLTGLARLHVAGTPVDWTRVLPAANRVELPTYAFQTQRYWAAGFPSLSVLRGASADAGSGGDRAGTAAEARFWAAIEGGDPQELSETLSVDATRPLGELLPALASWRRREHDQSVVTAWRYQTSWLPVPEPAQAGPGGTWLLVVPGGALSHGTDSADGQGPVADGPWGELALRCAETLAARGAVTVSLTATAAAAGRDEFAARIRMTLAASEAPAAAGAPVAGVLSLLALDESPVPGCPTMPSGLAGTLALIQALGDAGIEAPLWAVTQGAVAALPGEELAAPGQAHTWGLGRVAALEHPELWGGLVDLPAVFDERAAARLAAVLAGCGEDQVAVRPSGILARRLIRAAEPADLRPKVSQPTGPGRWQPRGSVLVTGGTGAIGGHVARWLVSRSAQRVILASRSGPAATGVPVLAAELAGAGAAVQITAADSASRNDLAALTARVAVDGPPLSAVFHAAGVGESAGLMQATPAGLAALTQAKAGGAAYLDVLTEDLELDAFVLFSSIAATWGSGLQPGYAAANAFLDALAENRRGRGLPAASVAWGPWGGGGLADSESVVQLQRHGLAPMEPALAVRALAQVLDSGETQVTVADVDWARFTLPFTLRRPSPLISEVPEVRQALAAGSDPEADGEHPETDLSQRLAGLTGAEQDRILVELVRAEAAAALGHSSAEAVEPGRAFRDLGFDSLIAVELRNRLRAVTGVALPATVAFDYPTSAALAEYLRTEISQEEPAVPPVFSHLDHLESILSGIPYGSDIHAEVTARLRTVLSKWVGGNDSPQQESAASKLESATADEVFDFINKEFLN